MVSVEEFWHLAHRLERAELVGGQVVEKVADLIRAGTQAVCVVDPEGQTVTVHSRDRAVRYGADETLDGGPVLPGLRLNLRSIIGAPA